MPQDPPRFVHLAPNTDSKIPMALNARRILTLLFLWAAQSAGAAPVVVNPAPSSSLDISSVEFSWTTDGEAVSAYWIYAGPAAGSNAYYNSGVLSASLDTHTIDGLPINGNSVFIRLWFQPVGESWQYVDSNYQTPGTVVEPSITAPSQETELVDGNFTVRWNSGTQTVDQWWLYVGSQEDGSDLVNSGSIAGATEEFEVSANNIILDGSLVHLKLWYRQSGGGWSFVNSQLATANLQEPPELTTPSQLQSATPTITWTNNDTPIKNWWLYVGTSKGDSDLFDSGSLAAEDLSISVPDLPTDGSRIYAKLWYRTIGNSQWQFREQELDAVNTPDVDLENYDLVFFDEFNNQTELDASKWNTGLLWGPYLPINNEEQLYVDVLGINANTDNSPFSFTDNTVKITASPTSSTNAPPARPAEDDDIWLDFPEYRYNGATTNGPGYKEEEVNYLSGIITSYDAFKFSHGYIEARVKLPAGQGLWPAFWLLNSHYVEDSPEIDIMEFLGQNTDKVYHTYHYFDIADNWRKISTDTFETVADDWTTDFHTFGLSWSPKQIVWYVDGKETKRITNADEKISGQSMYILANLAVGGNWPGSPDETTPFPAVYEIDYIRAYKRKISQPLDLNNDYQLMFSDEFNGTSLDNSKWNSHYLWGPYLSINSEEQHYIDALDTDGDLPTVLFHCPTVSCQLLLTMPTIHPRAYLLLNYQMPTIRSGRNTPSFVKRRAMYHLPIPLEC